MDYILQQIWERKFVFMSTFFVIFTLFYIVLIAIDFIPEPKEAEVHGEVKNEDESAELPVTEKDFVTESELIVKSQSKPVVVIEEEVVEKVYEFPVSIVIEKLGKEISVSNPTSRRTADLDAALLDGVVRHPDSAALNQDGNVFILGHSSYLPSVFNKNFQALNGIQDLAWGDTIKVYSENSVYKYRVEKVYRAKAQDLSVPIAGDKNRLTLATCNSFGSKDDRYIVEAERIDVSRL